MLWRFSSGWFVAVALAAVTASAHMDPAAAGESFGTPYLGVRAIGSVANIEDVTTPGFVGATEIQNDSDLVAGIGPVFGYALNDLPVRLELEVAHRFRFDLDARDNRVGSTIDHEVNVATESALVNVIVDWRNSTDFTPFVGGSLGWARQTTDTTRRTIGGSGSQHDNDKDNFAWGAMTGIDWALSDNWVAEFAYRYIDMGKVDTGLSPAGDSIKGDRYVSHDVMLGLFYRF